MAAPHGRHAFGLWPNAASALSCLRRRLPLTPEYLSHARKIAVATRALSPAQVRDILAFLIAG